MRLILYFLFLILVVKISQSSIYSDIQNNGLSLIKQGTKDESQKGWLGSKLGLGKYSIDTMKKVNEGMKRKHPHMNMHKNRAMIIKAKNAEKEAMKRKELMAPYIRVTKPQHHYHIDPVLNFIKRRVGPSLRRTMVDKKISTDDSSSSSNELKKWKDEWKEHWVMKKFEAINSSLPTGDTVNMVAARPWGVPCGDPNQHDLPWGSCMLPMECEPEYRIYRGDYFCGRTQFVCCALQANTYDMYQAFDASLADSDLSTDSEERKNRGKGSKERKKRKRLRDKRRRKKARLKRKRKIKRNIRKIIREITKILNRSYRNGTTIRKKKTKELKKYIKDLKMQYKKDQKSVKDVHEMELLNMDKVLMDRLQRIKDVNYEFIHNATFRDIVVNGTVNEPAAAALIQSYPELENLLDTRRVGVEKDVEDSKDYLEYDIEYGMLYD